MNNPLVSIICTCYNHENYIKESLDAVLNQSYDQIELIIIDNGSKDRSAGIIQHWVNVNQDIKVETIFHFPSINYCKAFNQGLQQTNGKYIIDLSGDDLLLPNHVRRAVGTLEQTDAAVYFSNAYLEGNKKTVVTFYPVHKKGKVIKEVFWGNLYVHVVQKHFLCAPTLVFIAEILKKEGGYDESLTYEDFDIIVRLSRKYQFVFNENIGVKKRMLKTSFSAQQYSIKKSLMLPSTLKVCRKIQAMNQSPEENKALQFRVMFETKHALASANFDIAEKFLGLAQEIGVVGIRYQIFRLWANIRLDLSPLYRLLKA
jgi:glycosyltransferase involved in cell wall biosynthesis